MSSLCYRELVHRQPVVARRIVEVDHPVLCAADRAVRRAVFHRHPVHEQPVQRPVTPNEIDPLGAGEFAEGVFQSLGQTRRSAPTPTYRWSDG